MSPAKPEWMGPRYDAIDPALLPADHWDDSEPSDIKELDQQLAKQSSEELDKVAVSQSRLRAIPSALALCVPVALSFAILQLSWRHLYWRDSNENSRAISEDLALLQIAAKAHEILILLSLSHIVLYYVRQQISSPRGLPFGLFSSAYQASLGSQPISFGFLYALKSSLWRRNTQWRYLSFTLALLLFTLLGLAVGPSSAVILIPRLDWWPDGDLFSFFTNVHNYGKERSSPFTMYIPRLLFPEVVDASSLPGLYCTDESLDINGSCPFAGFQDLLPTLDFAAALDNVTLDSPLRRVMATQTTDPNTPLSFASTWTTSYVLANYMSLVPGFYGSYVDNLNPITIQSIIHRRSTITPLVNVVCETQSAALSIRNISALAQEFRFLVGFNAIAPPSGDIDIRNIWNTTNLSESNETVVAFAENPPNATVPGLLSFVHVPGRNQGQANISMCLVAATWEPATMWALVNGQTGIVLSNFTWDGYDLREANAYDTAYSHHKPLKTPAQLTIRKAWADALNPFSTNSTTSVLAQFLQDGEEKARKQGEMEQGRIHSIMLSKAIADGISRIGAEYRISPLQPSKRNITVCRHRWCSQGAYINPSIKPRILNVTYSEARPYSSELAYGDYKDEQPLLKSFREPDDVAAAWTRISFPMRKYGYAWSFETTTVKVATAILMLHTLIIVMHCCFLLCTGRSYNFASSLGDLIALALISQPSVALDSTSVAMSKEASWARSIAVRESQGREKNTVKRLEIVTDDVNVKGEEDGILYRRVNVGQGYR